MSGTTAAAVVDTVGSAVPVVIMLPQHDRDGAPVETAGWSNEAVDLLAALFDTKPDVVPPVERGTEGCRDAPACAVYAVATEEAAADPARLRRLATFLRRFGRETRQSTVAVVIGRHLFTIDNFGD
jgi:hypothetical protein